MEQKDVFVTYAWDTDEHQQKVTDLVIYLREQGYDAEFDKIVSQNESSTDFTKMMTKAMTHYKNVIVVLSKKYKEKATTFEGGAGKEYGLIIKDIDDNPKKYILVSFGDERKDISPLHFKDREVIDISDLKNNNEIQNILNSKLQNKNLLIFPPTKKNKPKVVTKLADENKEKYFSSLKIEIDEKLKNNKYVPFNIIDSLHELSEYFLLIDAQKDYIFCERNVLGGMISPQNNSIEQSAILDQAKKVISICEDYETTESFKNEFIISSIEVILGIIQKLKERNCQEELDLINKLIVVKKSMGKETLHEYIGLATVFYTMGDYNEAEKCINHYFENLKEEETAENSTSLYLFLCQIQHNALKFKEALLTLDKIEKNADKYLEFVKSLKDNPKANVPKQEYVGMVQNAEGLKNNIAINRETYGWKGAVMEKLNYLSSVEISISAFDEFKNTTEIYKHLHSLFLEHIEVNKKNSPEKPQNIGFMYDYWGKSYYESILFANRFFYEKDTTIKVKVKSIEQIRNYLKILPLYTDSIVFLWGGELLAQEEAMLVGLPTFYQWHPKTGYYVLSLMKDEYHAITHGYFNYLPQYVFDFILGEAKPIFEAGYFTIIPMIQGGYIEHNKGNLIDQIMDNCLKPVSVINNGNLNANQYFQMPYIQNITFEELKNIIDEQQFDLKNLRQGIKKQQNKLKNGAYQSDMAIIAEEIKDSILIFTDKLKKTNRYYNIDFMPHGSDFFDLELSFDKYLKDYLYKQNEELASNLEKSFTENPYSLFIKTNLMNKSWNISPKYLIEDTQPFRPKWINHWLHGVSNQPRLRLITKIKD